MGIKAKDVVIGAVSLAAGVGAAAAMAAAPALPVVGVFFAGAAGHRIAHQIGHKIGHHVAHEVNHKLGGRHG